MLFHEYEIYGKYKEYYCYKVVPLQAFALEKYRNYDTEHEARYYLLDYFKLNQ